jgi:hypothetical protein
MNPPPQPIDLRLQISSFEDPIRGRLTDSDGTSVEFTGWIELSSALGEISGAGGEHIHPTKKEAGNGQ